VRTSFEAETKARTVEAAGLQSEVQKYRLRLTEELQLLVPLEVHEESVAELSQLKVVKAILNTVR